MPRVPRRFKKVKYLRDSTRVMFWRNWLKTYIADVKKDLSKIWELMFHQVIQSLMKHNQIKIPFLGVLRIVLDTPIKPIKFSFYSNKVKFDYPKTKVEFVLDKQLKEIFEGHIMTTYDIEQLNNHRLDWLKKYREKEARKLDRES